MKYYQIKLEDYAAPSFITWDKSYYGTIEHLTEFFNALKNDEKNSEDFKKLTEAFDEFCAGNENVTHNSCYKEIPLLTPITVLGRFSHTVDNLK